MLSCQNTAAPDFNPRLPGGRRRLPLMHCLLNTVISIHASRVGGDADPQRIRSTRRAFQSTPPGWEATAAARPKAMSRLFQSTPPGWEATRICFIQRMSTGISIHASRVGGDPPSLPRALERSRFQSTPPGWEATHPYQGYTHQRSNFNPRLPGGRRRGGSA